MNRPLYVGVLISGSGTNLQAIIDAIEAGQLNAKIAVVISSHTEARGLERARHHGVDAVYVDRTAYRTPREYNDAILAELQGRGVELVVMAGYMRLLGRQVLEHFPERVLNIHPSLLPSFAGPNGIKDAFEYGVKVTGVTVHFANELFDKGPIIAQEAVRIEEDDTLETLEAKIHEVEHRIYPRVIQLITEDRVRVEGNHARIVQE
jgi:phosphoribosylglycinamide formyltransferase-1